MADLLSFDDSIMLLKNAVKYSNIKGQKHLDLTIINAPDRLDYQKALMVVQSSVARGEVKQKEVNDKLGLT